MEHLTSSQKVAAAITHVEQLEPEPGCDPAQQAVMLAFTMFKPQLLALLPPDPAVLDELLLAGAAWALGLRSDDAPAFALAAAEAQPAIAP
jgi:hypothetical protein